MNPIIKESSGKTRRKFDSTFKREAVRNWLASGKSSTVRSRKNRSTKFIHELLVGVKCR